MFVPIIALLVSFVPVLGFYFWFKSFKPDKEYKDNCKKLLFTGFACATGVFLFSLIASLIWALTGMKKISPILNEAFSAFVLAALSEELVKGYFARKNILEHKDTVSWIDMIVFTGIVGISFNLLESFVYMFSTNIGQILVRGLTEMHMTFGLIMGYYYGKAIVKNKPVYKFLAFFIPWLIHGVYDFTLGEFIEEWCEYLIVGPFVTLFACMVYLIVIVVFIVKSRKKNENLQPILRPEKQEEINDN